jgi:hypothetical protein
MFINMVYIKPVSHLRPKNHQPTYLLCLLWMLCVFPVHAGDDVSQDVSVHVSAMVVASNDHPVSLVTLRDLVIRGEIRNAGQKIYVSPLESPFAGLIRAEGQPGETVRIYYEMNERLTDRFGNTMLDITYEMSGNNERIQDSGMLADIGEHEFRLNKEGCYYLWIGGWIDISTAAAGIYKGQFIIEIMYI